jgi:pyruvate kinase
MSVTLDRTVAGRSTVSLVEEPPAEELLAPIDLRGDVTRRRGGFRVRRAKIVCTLGPSTQSPQAIRSLVAAGMDVARLNFSHGTRDQHLAICNRVREAADACRRTVGVLADLQGPKVRLGSFEGGTALLEKGALFTLTATDPDAAGEAVAGSSRGATTSYAALPRDIAAGDTLLIDDGRIRLRAIGSIGNDVVCTVVDGGMISDYKGITLPGVPMSASALSEKDADDLRFALDMGVDMVALSFVRSPEDIEPVHDIMDAVGRRVPVIAKLERPEAVDQLAAIVAAFDGLMVARGDLGLETPLEQLPMIQKRAVRMARDSGKPVIVATQMLESMTQQPLPTRAEVCDVANAVLDGADALMLSAETSVGAHPVEAVRMMADIIVATERHGRSAPAYPALTAVDALASAASQIAASVDAQVLVVITETGTFARRLASHRGRTPILVLTPDPAVRHQLALTWGVETFVVPAAGRAEDMILEVERAMLDLGQCDLGDLIVSLTGPCADQEDPCATAVRIHRVGDRG